MVWQERQRIRFSRLGRQANRSCMIDPARGLDYEKMIFVMSATISRLRCRHRVVNYSVKRGKNYEA
jgi:hypothetical protein